MGEGQAYRVGGAVLFVLVVVAAVAAVDEVRLVGQVLRVKAHLQVFGQRVTRAEVHKGLRSHMGVVGFVVDPGQFIEVGRFVVG